MSIPKTPSDLFDHILPASLQQAPDRARALDTVFCFKLSGSAVASEDEDPSGDLAWTIDCSRDCPAPSCVAGASDKAHCTVELSRTDFTTFLADPSVGPQLYFQKRLRILGDPTRAPKIAALFELARAVSLSR
jgi:SCP-2 sterol transfer family